MKLLFLVPAVLLCGCGHADNSDTFPRRYAYPRAAVLPDSTRAAEAGGIAMSINAAARTEQPREEWLNASYDALGATLHITVLRPDNINKELANRAERISRNLGGAKATASRFTNGNGYECEVVSTSEGPATPVQFIACGPAGELVCGTFVLKGSTAPADSLRPIVDGLEREAISILNSLR